MLKEKNITRSPEKLHKKDYYADSDLSVFGKTVLTIIVSLVLSGTSITGTPIPAAAALCGALPPLYAAAALSGGIAGFLIRAQTAAHITDIIAMTVMVIFTAILYGIIHKKGFMSPGFRAMRAVFCGIIYIVSGTVVAVAAGFSGALELAVAFRGILSAIACYLFMTVITAFKGNPETPGKSSLPSGKSNLTPGKSSSHGNKSTPGKSSLTPGLTFEQKASLAAVFVLGITALSAVSIMGINLGRLAVNLAILVIGGSFGAGGCAIVYALALFGMVIYAPELGRSGVTTAIAAVTSGVFAAYGKLAGAVAFTTAAMLAAVMTGVPSGSLYVFAEILIAAFIYTLVPSKVYSPAVTRLFARPADDNGNMRLKLFAACYRKLSENLGHAAAILNNPPNSGKNNSIDFTAAFSQICAECTESETCPISKKTRFKRQCGIIETELSEKGYITPYNLFIEGCTKKSDIAENVNRAYNLTRFFENQNAVSSRLEDIAVAEMKAAQSLFESVSAPIIISRDMNAERVLKDSYPDFTITAGTDAAGFYHAESYSRKEPETASAERLIKTLALVTGRHFETPLIQKIAADTGFTTRMIISEEYKFRTDCGVFESPAPERISEGFSGDSHSIFEDGYGNAYFLISDGMGSGARAAVESSMTVSLAADLIKNGADPISAMNFVNLSLQIKSSDETTATIDLLCFNRYSGKTVICKMGAAKSSVVVGGSVREYEGASLPAGILTENEADEFSFRANKGDRFALYTDGITEEMQPKIREMLLSDGITAERAAKIIGGEKTFSEQDSDSFERGDDKTLLLVYVDEN